GLKDPCKVESDCQEDLLCQDDQTCGCKLGYYDGTCLQPIKSEDDECHVDGQCMHLFGAHGVCRHQNVTLPGVAVASRCVCTDQTAFIGDKCEPICTKDEE